MRVLALDIASKTGYAVFEGTGPSHPVKYGDITTGRTVKEFGPFPFNYKDAAKGLAFLLHELTLEVKPDTIVIEEINIARARYSQKLLDFYHAYLLDALASSDLTRSIQVSYVSTSEWRKVCQVAATPADKKANAALATAKRVAKAKGVSVDKTALGIKGKVTKKHLSVRWCNETLGTSFSIGQNDVAEAICLGYAFLSGCSLCTGS